jgi:hypothetical protein
MSVSSGQSRGTLEELSIAAIAGRSPLYDAALATWRHVDEEMPEESGRSQLNPQRYRAEALTYSGTTHNDGDLSALIEKQYTVNVATSSRKKALCDADLLAVFCPDCRVGGLNGCQRKTRHYCRVLKSEQLILVSR